MLIAGYLPELGGNAAELLRLIEPNLSLLPPAVWTPEHYQAAPTPTAG